MMPQPVTNDSPLPWEQHEYPGKRPVDDVRLHARREGAFLVLAGVFLVAAALLPVLGLSRVLDLSFAVPRLQLDVRVAVPLGALAFPLTFLCAHLVCELFGRRRAAFLVILGVVLAALAFGVSAAGRAPTPALWAPAAALVAFAAVAHLVNLGLFALVRRASGGRLLWLRHAAAALGGQLLGGAVFLAVFGSDTALWAALPYAAAAVVVGTPLLYLLAGWLGVYLRLPLAHQEARLPRARVHASPSAELV